MERCERGGELIELVAALRSEIDLGERTIAFTLPQRIGGLTPLLRYTTREIAYADIASVEERCEVYGGRLAPVFMRGVRLVLKNGERVPLGYVNDANVDPTFPFPEISEEKKKEIEEAAEEVLCVRAEHSEKTLAEMYDPDKMPADLRAAHHNLDLIVESCYRKELFTSDEERLEHLFKLYEKMTTKK